MQIIYEMDKGAIHLVTLKPDNLSTDQKEKFKRLGIEIPTQKYVCTYVYTYAKIFHVQYSSSVYRNH